MDSSNRTRMSAFLGGVLLAFSQVGHAVTISETPLFIATGVTPNVMLIVDNSGSMESIIWASGYDPTVIYPDWSPPATDLDRHRLLHHRNGLRRGLDQCHQLHHPGDAGEYALSRHLRRCRPPNPGQCATAGTTRGVSADGLTTKCLTLPDPAGGGITRYTGNYLNYLFETYANGTDLTTGTIPNDYRMNVAKNVAANVVNDNTNLRMGLTAFNTDDGGRVLQACNTGNTSALLTLDLRADCVDLDAPWRGAVRSHPILPRHDRLLQRRSQPTRARSSTGARRTSSS